jgi:hypothetical protein
MSVPAYLIDDAVNRSAAYIAPQVFERVFRTTYRQPGYGLIQFPIAPSARDFRAYMVDLKRELERLVSAQRRQKLAYLSMGRFDQQTTTKFHLDGAPEESVLMLGYEPSAVPSKMYMADYSRCAFDRGLSSKDFLDQLNPMFTTGASALEGYAAELLAFNPGVHQILLINNSSRCVAENSCMLGVMHKAIITAPNPAASRVVNSTMMFLANLDVDDSVSADLQEEFIASDAISRGPYGK